MYHTAKKRTLALFFLAVFFVGQFLPLPLWALTTGPSQPEMQGFQPAGVSDMVDLFSGDFKYNIPLLDVDGYPVNLAYASGVGMDDEASWVGLGWSLNVGSVNRQLRGLPDDFSGDKDKVVNEYYTKPKKTVGGTVYVKAEAFGKLKPNITGSLSVGVFNDSYTGMGATLGANAGLSLSLVNATKETAGLGLNAGLGLSASTQSGVDISPSLSLSLTGKMNDQLSNSFSLSTSIGYNTRSGLKALSLSQSFGLQGTKEVLKGAEVVNQSGSVAYDLGGTSFSFNTEPFYPKGSVVYKTASVSFTPNFGGVAWGIFSGIGGSGYANVREVKDKRVEKPAYGFLYADRGRDKPEALMDFTREKDNPIISELPNLAVPVQTPDLFSLTSHTGAGQFRLYRGGTGMFFDDKAADVSNSATAGFDVGLGGYFHGGVSYYKQTTQAVTQKWSTENQYKNSGDFQRNDGRQANADPVYFKQAGEKTIGNDDLDAGNSLPSPLLNALFRPEAKAVDIQGKTALAAFRGGASLPVLDKQNKAVKRCPISYLTAKDAAVAGLDKTIQSHPLLTSGFSPSTSANAPVSYPRIDADRKEGHISEFTVTDEGGKRMIYGLPVYNKRQEEYSFNVGTTAADPTTNLVDIGGQISGNGISTVNKGVDEYYSKQIQPAYATGYLLTGIVSPDYVDVTGNGISDDDRGTAVKFNYTRTNTAYRWRTPLEAAKASYNKGLLADPDDQKGNIIYGEKELWYLQSVETRTKIAYFILEDRDDALGVVDWKGGVDQNNGQKRLKEIWLYSKADLTKPIKKVVLTYDYSLCPGVANQKVPGAGKLTLTGLYFLYGNSQKGGHHKYQFAYENNAAYSFLSTDRWGQYKPFAANQSNGIPLRNDEFPYTVQNKREADDNGGKWLLSKIELPGGGSITVSYEADDYAYVQNKRAMKMVGATALIDGAGTVTKLNKATGVRFQLSVPAATANPRQWFMDNYLNGSEYLYGKLFVKIGTDDAVPVEHRYDFVPCYAKITNVVPAGNEVAVYFEPVNENVNSNGGLLTHHYNPFSVAAWQKMRMEYPRYAYPGYDNRPANNDIIGNFVATVNAIFNVFKTLGELKENFYQRADRKDFASEVDLSKSFFRLTDATGFKTGGGSRVKKIMLSDNWAAMSGNGYSTVSGTVYDYTTTVKEGEGLKTVSSGVASFEPSLGGDENPLRQPVPYLQRIKGALSNMFYLEQPFGESFFPSPSVGYSTVKVRNLTADGEPDPAAGTGWSVSEFYTAKDFPTLVGVSAMKKEENGPRSASNLFGGFGLHELTLSQGYRIEVNDMHGKQRMEKVFDGAGNLLSSAEYIYNATPISNGEWRLNNDVAVLDKRGTVHTRTLGRDVDFFTDFRESEYASYGQSINLGADVVPGPFGIPFPFPHWPKNDNDEYRLFRSAAAIEVIQLTGLVKRVIKMQNGSTVAAENLLYDPFTGEVLVTQTANEHKRPIYSVTLPAHWMYPRTGGGYKTNQTLLADFQTSSQGTLVAPSHDAFLIAGDELLASDGRLLWVIESTTTVNGVAAPAAAKRVINAAGALVRNFNGWVKVIRSGNRNLVSASAASFVCFQNPIAGDKLLLIDKLKSDGGELSRLQLLDAKASRFTEDWAGDAPFDNTPAVFNPYIKGYKGDWRPVEAELLQVARTYGLQASSEQAGLNAPIDGFYTDFRPYWLYQSSNDQWTTSSSWTTATKMTLYDKWGQELENKNALGLFSSAQFGFKGNVTTAVASNAKHREIFYEGFEDLRFQGNGASEHPSWFNVHPSLADETQSHTGRYSYKPSELGLYVSLSTGEHQTTPYLATNEEGAYVYKTEAGLYNQGFQPIPSKPYIFSVWVKDGHPQTKGHFLKVTANGNPIDLEWKATVEGWKLTEGVFVPQGATLSMHIDLSGGSLDEQAAVRIDDLRIFPKDAHLKSFAYDDRTLRLMAQLDENNFATFYEYDEEGILNRVKRETERGIMTLKETRSTYRKN